MSALEDFEVFCQYALKTELGHPFQIEPFQRPVLEDYFSGVPEMLVLAVKKVGKALATDTRIPTPFGWTTMGEIRPGDVVFDEEGEATHVIAVSPVETERRCYRVRFSDDTSIIAADDHLWATRRLERHGYSQGVWTTEEIAATLQRERDGAARHSIPVAEPLNTQPADLPVDPYLFGVWLGDGHSASAQVTAARRDVRAMERQLAAVGVTPRSTERPGAWNIRLGGGCDLPPRRGWRGRPCPICGVAHRSTQTTLREMGVLNNKHIPVSYLRASRLQRLALLQGLLDTDGSVTLGKYGHAAVEFGTSSPALRDGMMELLRSLGFKPMVRGHMPPRGREAFRITFAAGTEMPLFRLPRKLKRQKAGRVTTRRRRSKSRQIVGVESVPSVPVCCIQVASASCQYLAGEGMIPTHNSTLVAAMALFELVTGDDLRIAIAAQSRDQAQRIVDQAAGMVDRSEWLKQRVRVKRREIGLKNGRGMIECLAADVDTADGWLGDRAFVDELHRAKSIELYSVLAAGVRPRGGQVVTITTAGDDEESPLGAMRQKAQLLPGYRVDGAYRHARSTNFAFHEWACPSDVALDDFAQIKLAHPASWVTEESLQAIFESPGMVDWYWQRFFMGQWVMGEDTVIQAAEWDALYEPGVEIPAGAEVWLGLDVAFTTDCTAVVAVWRRGSDDWVVAGTVVLEPPGHGAALDEREIVEALRGFAERFRVRAVAYDPWNAEGLAQRLGREMRCDWVRYDQKPGRMAACASTMLEAVRTGTLHHDGDRVLRQHVLSAGKRSTFGDEWRFARPRGPRRPIDALTALTFALDCGVRGLGSRRGAGTVAFA